MEPGSPRLIAVIIVLICLSALFSASETALSSLSKIRLRNMQDEGIKGASRVARLKENPGKLLSAILVGNNIVNILASSIATALAVLVDPIRGVGIATAVMTVLILIFGEITPKIYAEQNSEKVSLKVSGFISAAVFILAPIVAVLNFVTDFVLKIIGGSRGKKPVITEAELKTIVNVSQEEGLLEAGERLMINNVFDFGDTKAKDIMTPRTDMAAVSVNAEFSEVVEIFSRERYSRVPVYNEDLDDIVGVLHFKDIAFLSGDGFKVESYMHEPFFTYESKGIPELFNEMREGIIPMAVILDEYGGTSGIVTMEDIVEEIVGEIADEYDEDEEEIKIVKEDEFIVDGGTKIDDVNEMLGINLESQDFETIGGFVTGVLGRFPKPGETIDVDGIIIIVEEIDKNRVTKVKVYT